MAPSSMRHEGYRPPPAPLASAWDEAYAEERPPWDSGQPAPQLVAVLTRGRLSPSTALELGCGTGTNAIYLAQQGWAVTAVDASRRALRAARRKARAVGVLTRRTPRKPGRVHFVWADVTDLWDFPVVDFVFDRGCFHTLNPADRLAFLRSLKRVTQPGAVYFMLCGSPKERHDTGIPKLPKRVIRETFRRDFRIVEIADIRFESDDGGEGPRGYACLLVRRERRRRTG